MLKIKIQLWFFFEKSLHSWKAGKVQCRSCKDSGYTTEQEIYPLSSYSISSSFKRPENEAECAKECDLEIRCVAFTYNADRKVCALKSAIVGEAKEMPGYTFHRKCGQTELNCTGLDD